MRYFDAKKDGYEVCKTLQSIPATASVPFIFLTAKTQKAELRQGMQLGADDYITKPFSLDELIKSVKIRLQKRELIQSAADQKFFALVENPLTGIFIYQNNKFTFTNTKLNQMLGFTSEQIRELSFEDLTNNVECPENDAAIEKLHNCLKDLQNNAHVQLVVLRKDGYQINTEIFVSSIRMKGKEALIGNIVEIVTGEKPNQLSYLKQKIKLSEREMEVLKLICEGLSTAEIAEKIFLSNRTIDTHRANLLIKTESRNTADLVMFAIRNNVVEL